MTRAATSLSVRRFVAQTVAEKVLTVG